MAGRTSRKRGEPPPSADPDDPLGGLLTAHVVRLLAEPKPFERGERYAREGRVVSLTRYRGEVLATVRGTRDYQVRIQARGDRLLAFCSCPAWTEGAFCKHC